MATLSNLPDTRWTTKEEEWRLIGLSGADADRDARGTGSLRVGRDETAVSGQETSSLRDFET